MGKKDFDLDLNSAPLEDLMQLPMFDEYTAQSLIQARPFTAWPQVAHVEGIGHDKMEQLKAGGARIEKAA